jgi:nicotinamidase-related amidase
MATLRAGRQPALLIVDAQVGVLDGTWNTDAVIQAVVRSVDRAREQKVPVLWVQHESDELVPGTAAWQWAPCLLPAAGEPQFGKRFNSSFEQTPLEEHLARLGVTELVLAGAMTNWCIRATAYAALERGYDLTLVGDAHTTADLELDEGRRVDARAMVDDLNLTMRWLEVPDRRSRCVPSHQLDFSA